MESNELLVRRLSGNALLKAPYTSIKKQGNQISHDKKIIQLPPAPLSFFIKDNIKLVRRIKSSLELIERMKKK